MKSSSLNDWIGLRENLNRKPSVFSHEDHGLFRFKFSLKPIHWLSEPIHFFLWWVEIRKQWHPRAEKYQGPEASHRRSALEISEISVVHWYCGWMEEILHRLGWLKHGAKPYLNNGIYKPPVRYVIQYSLNDLIDISIDLSHKNARNRLKDVLRMGTWTHFGRCFQRRLQVTSGLRCCRNCSWRASGGDREDGDAGGPVSPAWETSWQWLPESFWWIKIKIRPLTPKVFMVIES